MAPHAQRGCDCGHETDGPADEEPAARSPLLGDPTDQRATEGRAAEEHQGVQGHDPAPHLVARAQLQGRVGGGDERHRADAHGDEADHRHDGVRGEGHEHGEHRESDGRSDQHRAGGAAPSSGAQTTDQAAGSQGREQGAVQPRPATEHVAGEEGEHDDLVEAEGGDDRDEQQCGPQDGRVPDVAQALTDLALRPGYGLQPRQLARAHGGQGRDHGDEGDGVEQERGRDPDGVDEDAGQGRTDQTGTVEHGAVEPDGVGDVIGADHLDHERLTGGIVEDGHAPEQEGEDVDHPQLGDAGQHDQEEGDGEHGRRALCPDERAALVESVGNHAAPHAEEQHGKELQGHHQAQGGACCCPSGEVQDEPALRGRLHPCAAQGDELGEEEQPVVPHVERVERALSRQANTRHGLSPSNSFSRMLAARASTARSSASSVRMRAER